ncbi:HEPN domain-containing protein [Novosphingobium sp. AP12]|uniref:HEPN domain-containing protein n=1 Tax=Novosphingobium sp. AP12 TaxID=1144305 RepID=UPI0002721E7E|nr:HEPN domain-containing protein [Novosphingobium sp. AP12]EJL33762.1 hypothetical protein PMI02_00999 [Novosphingobium sp. AP12]
MKTDLAHLPPRKRSELERVVTLVFEYFDVATAEHARDWKKKGRINKIILYGSHARGSWVHEPHTIKGYRSDFDILVIVNNKRLTDPKFWYGLETHLQEEFTNTVMRTPVSLIVHSLQEVNNDLAQGRYFFVDIAREGVILYESDTKALRKPIAKTPADALAQAREYYDSWYPDAAEFYDDFKSNLEKGRLRKAAFELHQCVEQLYHTVLLVMTSYTPHSHNIRHLRHLAEQIDRRLVYVWPTDTKRLDTMFSRLKDAYVKARYSKQYYISNETLIWLGKQTEELARVTKDVCCQRIKQLESDVSTSDQICAMVANT